MNRKVTDKPSLYTVLSPALLDLHDLTGSVVVVIDVLRATSTIATALYNGAKEIIPVNSVAKCIELSRQMDAISAGERDGQVAEGLQYGNSPLTYTRKLIEGKILVLTTTNGTRLLRKALAGDAEELITASFVNLSYVCRYLAERNKNVILACSAWRNRINLEDTLLAGAVVHEVGPYFEINCDSSAIASDLYSENKDDLFTCLSRKNASHYQRLKRLGMEEDIRYCLQKDAAPVLPIYREGRLVSFRT